MVAPDATTFAYLKGRPKSPKGAAWDAAMRYWQTLRTDDGAHFDVTYGLEKPVDKAGTPANKNTVPTETGSPFVTSGLRLGTPAVTVGSRQRNREPEHRLLHVAVRQRHVGAGQVHLHPLVSTFAKATARQVSSVNHFQF